MLAAGAAKPLTVAALFFCRLSRAARTSAMPVACLQLRTEFVQQAKRLRNYFGLVRLGGREAVAVVFCALRPRKGYRKPPKPTVALPPLKSYIGRMVLRTLRTRQAIKRA